MSLNRAPGKLNLSNEELQALLNKMSSDDRNELTGTLKQCTSEMTLTRGIPITAAVLGSLYYSRTHLPPQYHFGPKGWPFYAIMGIGTLTAVNVFSMGTCRDRIQPLVAKFFEKYNIGQSATSYDAIRRHHREEYGYSTNNSARNNRQTNRTGDLQISSDRRYADPYGTATEAPSAVSADMSRSNYDQTYDFSTDVAMTEPEQQKPLSSSQGYMYGLDTPSYMSGTPTSPRSSEFSSEFSR